MSHVDAGGAFERDVLMADARVVERLPQKYGEDLAVIETTIGGVCQHVTVTTSWLGEVPR
jgi:hypothetical protein